MESAPRRTTLPPALTTAPGVRIVMGQGPQGTVYHVVDAKRAIRVPLNEKEYEIVSLLRNGVSPEEAARRIGGDLVPQLCHRLLAANLLAPVVRPGFLPDDRPRLIAGVQFYRSEKPGLATCREPRSGRTFTVRDVDAMIARACNGQRTILEICEAAQSHGIPANVDAMSKFLRELHAMGILEGSPAAAPPPELTDEEVEARISAVEELAGGSAAAQPAGAAAPTNAMPISALSEKLDALHSLSMNKEADPAAPAPRGGSKLPWFLLILVCGGGGGYLAWQRYQPGGGKTEVSAKGPEVRIETVSSAAPSTQPLNAAGYIAAQGPIVVAATTSGRVKDVLVSNGDRVKKNHLLVQIDDGQAKAELGLALAKARDARRTLARVKGLYAAQGATPADVERAEGQVEIAQAEANVIVQRIAQAKVRSPIDGTILDVLTHPGELLTAMNNTTAGVVKVADLSKLAAELDVAESDVPLLHLGQSVDVTADAYPGRVYSGQIKEIAQQADRARGTLLVKVYLQVPDHSLKPGMSVKGTTHPDAGAAARLLIPRSAVTDGAVWLVSDDGTVRRRAVKVQGAGPNTYEVEDGLKAGDRVVTEGGAGLHAGQKVE